jgi:type IV pilus assembly protein PilA
MDSGAPRFQVRPGPPSEPKQSGWKSLPTIVKIIIGAAIVFGCGVPFLGIAAAIVIPGLMRARISGNEASAIGTMRAIVSAQMTYASVCANGLFARSLPVLGKAPTDGSSGTGFLSPDLAIGERVEKSGYVIWIQAPPPPTDTTKPCNGAGVEDLSTTFVAKAEPKGPSSGRRYFATSAKGVVYQSPQPITFDADGTAESPAVPVQ